MGVLERELEYHEKLYSGFAQQHFARPAVRALRAHMVATLLTLLHEKLFDEAAKTGHTRGWTQSLDKLEALFG